MQLVHLFLLLVATLANKTWKVQFVMTPLQYNGTFTLFANFFKEEPTSDIGAITGAFNFSSTVTTQRNTFFIRSRVNDTLMYSN